MTDLTAKQEQEIQKRLSKVIVELMRLTHTHARSKVGINRDFSDEEHLCFGGYIAAFCDCFAQQYYDEESCSETSCAFYTEVRKDLYNDKKAIVNPLERIEEFMEVEEFREGFVAGLNDVTEYFRNIKVEKKERSLWMGQHFISTIKNL